MSGLRSVFVLPRQEALDNILGGVSGLYAMLLVTVYLSFAFTELVTFPKYQQYLEINGFFVYLYAISVVFLLYVLIHAAKGASDLKVVENHKSHGSLTIRFGSVVFGVGTVIYFTLELIAFVEMKHESKCFHPTLGANVVLALVFVVLQAAIIFVYPRLNLRVVSFFDKFGTMHVVGTNIILWVRTLIKESLHEIAESEDEAHKQGAAIQLSNPHRHSNCSPITELIRQYEHKQYECMKHHEGLLGDALIKSSPYLFPFVIEFALIGASVLFIMWRHVGKLPKSSGEFDMSCTIRKPNPREFLRKGDWSHSIKGITAGFLVIFLAFLNLCLFFGLDGHHANEDEAEFYSKLTNTVTNLIGILALIVGLNQIQHLDPRDTSEDDESDRATSDLDLALLRFTAFFSFLYQNFTVITGSFNTHVENFPNALHIVNGVVETAQICMQIIFIIDLKQKVLPSSQTSRKPGRQVTVFLFLLNLAQWVVFTFEIQKVKASLVEANFYGFMPWVVIQRVTLPLAVFFRFHSAVVNMELWKEIYGKS